MTDRIDSPEPDRPRRGAFAVRVRTLLALIVVTALGMAAWQGYQRSRAVHALVDCLKLRVMVSIAPTSPDRDPVFDPSGRYAPAIREVRRRHAESQAVAVLTDELRAARILGDEPRMRSALAALQDLGPDIVAAGAEVRRVAIGEEFPKVVLGDTRLAQGLAVHVLGKIAKHNPKRLKTLVEVMEINDHPSGNFLRASAANELAPFGERGKVALPALRKLIDDRRCLTMEYNGLALLNAIGRIGPPAREAVPRLMEIARDGQFEGEIRRGAVHAVANLLPQTREGDRGTFDPELVAFLRDLADDPDPAVGEAVGFFLGQARRLEEVNRRREALNLLIASDRARQGKPRPPESSGQ